MKWSNGRLRLNAEITQSRHGHICAHAVVLVAVRVGVARDVEPVGGHALAVGGRGQQAIDDLLVGVGRAIGEERIDLGERRRQARSGRRSRAAARSRAALRATASQPLRLERREHEAIDRRRAPSRVVVTAGGGGFDAAE